MVQEKTEICVMHQNLSPKWDGKASSTRIVGRPTGLLLIEPYVHVGQHMQVGNEVRPILLIFVTNHSLRCLIIASRADHFSQMLNDSRVQTNTCTLLGNKIVKYRNLLAEHVSVCRRTREKKS